jgi:coenzyme A diphosphatase NUDT7
MSGSLEETEIAPETNITIDENEVKGIIESIKEAQYFDASSMAPLTPAAWVSLSYLVGWAYLTA